MGKLGLQRGEVGASGGREEAASVKRSQEVGHQLSRDRRTLLAQASHSLVSRVACYWTNLRKKKGNTSAGEYLEGLLAGERSGLALELFPERLREVGQQPVQHIPCASSLRGMLSYQQPTFLMSTHHHVPSLRCRIERRSAARHWS